MKIFSLKFHRSADAIIDIQKIDKKLNILWTFQNKLTNKSSKNWYILVVQIDKSIEKIDRIKGNSKNTVSFF